MSDKNDVANNINTLYGQLRNITDLLLASSHLFHKNPDKLVRVAQFKPLPPSQGDGPVINGVVDLRPPEEIETEKAMQELEKAISGIVVKRPIRASPHPKVLLDIAHLIASGDVDVWARSGEHAQQVVTFKSWMKREVHLSGDVGCDGLVRDVAWLKEQETSHMERIEDVERGLEAVEGKLKAESVGVVNEA